MIVVHRRRCTSEGYLDEARRRTNFPTRLAVCFCCSLQLNWTVELLAQRRMPVERRRLLFSLFKYSCQQLGRAGAKTTTRSNWHLMRRRRNRKLIVSYFSAALRVHDDLVLSRVLVISWRSQLAAFDMTCFFACRQLDSAGWRCSTRAKKWGPARVRSLEPAVPVDRHIF